MMITALAGLGMLAATVATKSRHATINEASKAGSRRFIGIMWQHGWIENQHEADRMAVVVEGMLRRYGKKMPRPGHE
jgi:hypothetical protein